jgi:hypothetical protein
MHRYAYIHRPIWQTILTASKICTFPALRVHRTSSWSRCHILWWKTTHGNTRLCRRDYLCRWCNGIQSRLREHSKTRLNVLEARMCANFGNLGFVCAYLWPYIRMYFIHSTSSTCIQLFYTTSSTCIQLLYINRRTMEWHSKWFQLYMPDALL